MTDIVPVEQDPWHHVVFENEHVRIFNVEVPPHRATRVHRHDHDYYVVFVGAGDVEDTPLGESAERKHFNGGETSSGIKGFTHQVRNLGDAPFRNVVVELKGP